MEALILMAERVQLLNRKVGGHHSAQYHLSTNRSPAPWAGPESRRGREGMLSNLGLWLIGAGMLLATFGLIGLAFSRNRQGLDHANAEQLAPVAEAPLAPIPIDPPKRFGRRAS